MVRKSLYFINAWVDFACIGALSIGLYLLFRSAPQFPLPDVLNLAALLTLLCNWPHFSATSYRLYSSLDNIRQYPMTALAIPLLLIAAVIASLAWPDRVAPAFVHLFLLWSPYHYSGQSVGISLIYARRAGFNFGSIERRCLSGFIFGSFLLSVARQEIRPGTYTFYGINYPSLGLPPGMVAVLATLMWGCGIAFISRIGWIAFRARRLVPPIVLLPGIAQFVWFVPGIRLPSFSVFVPFFHGLQYLLIAWAMQLKETMDRRAIPPSTNYVKQETGRWGLLNLLGGVVLFWGLPRACALITGRALMLVAPVMVAAVQIHHFFVDGVIWKLRHPTVGTPLLVNLDQMLATDPSGVAARATRQHDGR